MIKPYVDYRGLAVVKDGEMGDAESNQPHNLFPPTRWSLVAQSRDSESSGKALSELCEIYWYPVYSYIRCLGKDHQDAEDLTQGFLASMLDRGTFQKGDEQRGKLRVYLIVAVRRFVISADRKDNREKRGGGVVIASLDAERAKKRFDEEPIDPHTPESRFEQAWATALLSTAMEALKAKYKAREKTPLLDAMLPYIVPNEKNEKKHGVVAAELGMSVTAYRMRLLRMRQSYHELLKSTIADTLIDPSEEEMEEERAYLVAVVARG